MVTLEAEIPANFGNVVLQPEGIKSYFKNPDSTWTYLIRWKDIWLHESLCVSFTNLVDEFWENEESRITELAINKARTKNTGVTNTCDITHNNTCGIPDAKMYGITIDNTFIINNKNCNEANINQLTTDSITEFSCNTQVIDDDGDGETSISDIGDCENTSGKLVESKDNLKEIIIGVPFEQALSELDDETRNRLIQSLNEVPVSVNTDGDAMSNTLNYHVANQLLQNVDNPVYQHQVNVLNNTIRKIEKSGQKAPRCRRNNPIECETCHKVLSSRNSLREHRITMHLKNGRFPCDDCGKRFTHQRALRLHRVMHTKDRNFVCQICNSSHKRERELELHIRDMHTSTQSYRCDVCFQCFKMKGSLKNHCFTEHETTVTNCIVCKQKLTTPFSIYTHCLKHAEPREFKCSLCSREFKSKAQLKKHFAVHDPEKRPYKQCPKCLKLIFSRSHYYEHVNSHDNDTNEIIRFNCTQCDASFQHSSSLKRHRIRHRPGGDLEYPKQNPYIEMDENMLPDLCCKRCRKLYASKSGYYEHIKRCRDGVSTEELCMYCNKMYSSRKTLNRHVRNKHPMEEAARALYDKEDGKFGCLENGHDNLSVHIVTVVRGEDNELGINPERQPTKSSIGGKSIV